MRVFGQEDAIGGCEKLAGAGTPEGGLFLIEYQQEHKHYNRAASRNLCTFSLLGNVLPFTVNTVFCVVLLEYYLATFQLAYPRDWAAPGYDVPFASFVPLHC